MLGFRPGVFPAWADMFGPWVREGGAEEYEHTHSAEHVRIEAEVPCRDLISLFRSRSPDFT
jgi:hypothetical protein